MKLYAYEGAWQMDTIVIVGVGGTGSALARLVARMLWQRERLGQSVPTLHLIDPDVVETKNIIRQGFAPAEVGMPKAQAIGRRYSLAYGLPIRWTTEPFDPDQHIERGSILIDCTDNYQARRAIIAGVEQSNAQLISSGNTRHYGQVILGNCGSRDQMATAIENMSESRLIVRRSSDQQHTPCYHLPHFGLIYPEMLEPDPEPEPIPERSCAELAALGEQHPLINETMAQVVAQYLYKLLHREPITTFMTLVDIHNLNMSSCSISPQELKFRLQIVNSNASVEKSEIPKLA